MANKDQLAILEQGIKIWNKWREENPDVEIDLSGAELRNANLYLANLRNANLEEVDLSNANLTKADLIEAKLFRATLFRATLTEAYLHESVLIGANLIEANLRWTGFSEANLLNVSLSKADLRNADLSGANLSEADLSGANLSEANLRGADLSKAKLSGADLSGANLSKTKLCETNFSGADLMEANLSDADLSYAYLSHACLSHAKLSRANLSGADLSGADLSDANIYKALFVETNIQNSIFRDCQIYGVSVWDSKGTPAEESDGFVITPEGQPEVTVDNLKMAQFIYLLLNNEEIRDLLDIIGKKGVLILGRFSRERKQVLDALRDKLRTMNFVPMMFDFEGATTKDFTETVKVLAGMCRFIIADITSPKSSPLELQATVPDYKVPFVPIIQEGEEPFSMFADLQEYPWMFKLLEYKDCDQLIAVIERARIQPALIRADELNAQKAESVRKEHAKDYLEKVEP